MAWNDDYDFPSDDFYTGDPRRCAVHPNVATSSPDGLFDAPCPECEFAMDEDAARDAWDSWTPEERARFEAIEVPKVADADVFLADDDIPF